MMFVMILASASIIAACGGGGGASTNTTTTTPVTGSDAEITTLPSRSLIINDGRGTSNNQHTEQGK